MLHSKCQQIWTIQQWPQCWKRSVFFPMQMKGNSKECSTYHAIVLISLDSKLMLKILQDKFQQYMNWELPDTQTGLRNQRSNCQIHWIIEKTRKSQKNISICFTDNAKAFRCVDHNRLWKILFFFKFNFIKLYNIVLVLPYIKMNLSQVYMHSPSWTLLPPPSPYHSSGSTQCTSPKHPVSCIEPGLVTRFIYDIIHISMPFSQIIPPSPSPTECKRLFYISMSLLLSCIQGYCYCLSKFHIYALIYCIGKFLRNWEFHITLRAS